EAAAVNQVNDELELVEAFEIRDLGLVARFREGLEARLDQFTYAAAKYGLLAKEIGLGLFGKSRLQNAGARAAESFCVSESESFRCAAALLFDRQEPGCAAAVHYTLATS